MSAKNGTSVHANGAQGPRVLVVAQLYHTDRGGHSPGWRAQQAGYSGMAGWENIAAGQATPDDVVTAWYTSLDHRRNMLDCSLTDIGVGYGYSTGSTYHSYWTEAFGRH